jgi:ribonucleotide monophosphatase NagD (HAD superfamily)
MFLEAELEHDLNLMECIMIGDSVADMEAGEMLGMDTMLVLSGRGSETMDFLPEYEMPTFIVQDLAEGALKICQ